MPWVQSQLLTEPLSQNWENRLKEIIYNTPRTVKVTASQPTILLPQRKRNKNVGPYKRYGSATVRKGKEAAWVKLENQGLDNQMCDLSQVDIFLVPQGFY